MAKVVVHGELDRELAERAVETLFAGMTPEQRREHAPGLSGDGEIAARVAAPDFDEVAARAYHAPVDCDGVAVLPAEWDDWDD